MATFEERVLKLECQEPNHDAKPIIMVCFKPDCLKRKSCLTCIDEFHADHKDQLAIIADIEEFIKKNSVSLRGSGVANSILNHFEQFKQDIIKHLNVTEYLLKEKVSQLFTAMNNPDKLQQLGDQNPQEQELIELQNQLQKTIDVNVILQEFKKINKFLTPLNLKIERLDTLEKDSQLIDQKTIYLNSFKALQTVRLLSFSQPELFDEKDQVRKVVYTIYKNRDFNAKLKEFEVQLDHKAMTKKGGYQIDLDMPIWLQSGEEYSIAIRSQQTFKLQKYGQSGLDNPFIRFQDIDMQVPMENMKVVSEWEFGQFVSFQIEVDQQ